MTAREEMLNRIRTALPSEICDVSGSYSRIVRDGIRSAFLSRKACLDLFLDRLLDYDTEIVQVDEESNIAEAVAEVLAGRTESGVVAAREFPAAWLPDHARVVRDAQLSSQQIESEATVITTCEVAIALTGTILLVHTGAQGRRVLTLLPDHHICIVRRDQVVETVAEALAIVAPFSTRPMTTISGPSATSDIEMTRIRGVHGPRQLTVILYGALARDE
jgi:L-lactate dehydrogenase complex protein LldG